MSGKRGDRAAGRGGPRPGLSYANVISTIALFFALGGGAFAAVNSYVGSKGQVQGCVATKGHHYLQIVRWGTRCPKRTQALAFNQTGPAGPRGVQGGQGGQGLQGPTGPQGPSSAFSATANGTAVTAATTTVATLNLAAGTYVIDAKAAIDASNTGSFTWGVVCTLSAGGSSDTTHGEGVSSGGADGQMPASLIVTVALPSPATESLACSGTAGTGGMVSVNTAVISAIAVGHLN